MKNVSKFLFTLFALVVVVGLTACNGNDGSETADLGSSVVDEIDGEELPAEIQALVDQFDLPQPRFVPDSEVPSWMRDQEHHVELTWYVNMFWWPESRLGDRFVTSVIQDDLQIDIHFISGNMDNLNSMIIGGDMPDIITMESWATDLVSHAYEFALPLDVLAEVYDPYFLSIFPTEFKGWLSLDDGHLYGIPNEAMTSEEINSGFATPMSGFLVRQDIYEAIGSPDMTTPEGFLQALRDAYEYMPEIDGGIPLTAFSGVSTDIATGNNGSFSYNLQDFLGIPIMHPDGTWYDRDADPEYLEWMLIFHQAMEEGLMRMDQFVDQNEDILNRLERGEYFAFMTNNTNDAGSRINNIENDSPHRQYIAISGPRNRAGDPHTFGAGGINGWTHTFISQTTTDPQTAMQVLTYFWSDHGQMVQQYGVYGETWHYVDGVPTFMPEQLEIHTNDYYGFRDVYGMRTFWMLRRTGFFVAQGVLPTGPSGDISSFNREFAQSRLEFVNLDPVSGELGRDNDNLNIARSQAIFNMFDSNSAAEATQIWQDFLDSRDIDFDFDGITEYRNARLMENRTTLGID